VRTNLTTVLDLLGALLVIAALTVWIAGHSLPLALAAAGASLLAFSWLTDTGASPRRPRRVKRVRR
jgi:hypothetical protein